MKGALALCALLLCLLAYVVPAQTFAEGDSPGYFITKNETKAFDFHLTVYLPDWVALSDASASDVTLQVSRNKTVWYDAPSLDDPSDISYEYASGLSVFNVGTYTFYLRALDADGNVVAEAEDTLTITQFELVLTPQGCTKTYGDADPTLDVTTNAGIYEATAKGVISYEVTREPGEAVGEYKMQVTTEKEDQDSFHVSCDNDSENTSLVIEPKDCAELTVSDIDDVVYTGEAIEPDVQVEDLDVKIEGIDKELVKGRDFTLSYSNNVEVGAGCVTIAYTGNYCGTTTVNFNIVRTAAAQVVVDLLDSLVVTSLDDTSNVRQAYASYQLLTDLEKQTIPASSLKKLELAFEKLEKLEAEEEAAEYAQMVQDFKDGKDTIEYKGATYRCIGSKKLALVKAPNKKKFTVPTSIVVYNSTYKVTRINKNAFKKSKKLVKVTLGNFVSKIQAKAFTKSKTPKLKTVVVKTKKLTKKSSVKNCFKNSTVKKVLVKVSSKKSILKRYAKKYAETLGAKKVSGKKVTVKWARP